MVFSCESCPGATYQLIFISALIVQNCPTVHTTELGPSGTNGGSTLSSVEAGVPSRTFQNPWHRFSDFFPRFWNRMNLVIALFVAKFESVNQTPILVDRRLRETVLFEAGDGIYNGALRLEFRASNAWSSVFIQVPCLGVMYQEGLELSMYERETYMYDHILPAMHRAWPLESFSPFCYVTMTSGIVVVQNLREIGYQTQADMLEDPALCGTVFLSLARFHGLSRLHLEAVPTDGVALSNLNAIDRGECVAKKLSFHIIGRKFRTHLIPSLSADLRTLFETMIENVHSIVQLAHLRSPTGLNVILHGNANRANVFISGMQDATNLRLCKFVNFQNSRIGPPVIDLISYLITSVEFAVFQEHQELLFGGYVGELNAVLLAMDSNYTRLYSLQELYAGLSEHKMYFVYELVFKVPLHWTRFAGVQPDYRGPEDEYDRLLKNEKFVTFFKNWMRVFLSW